MLELGRRVTSLLDLDLLLPEASRLIASAFGYDIVGINLLDPLDSQRLYQAAAYPVERTLPASFRVPLGSGLTGWVAQHGEPRLANDVLGEVDYIPGPGRERTRSELDIPLKIGRDTIGVLNVESERIDAFSASDVPYLEGIAAQLAQAIENARLAARARELAAAEERARIARDLHDETVQALVAIGRQLDLLELDLNDAGAAERRLESLHGLVGRTLDGVRRLSRNLRPAILEDLGLLPALRAHVEELAPLGLDVRLDVQGEPRPLPAAVEYALFRIAQESLSNVLRHAEVSQAWLELDFADNDLAMVVRDAGVGAAAVPVGGDAGRGIQGMRDRAAEIRARLEIDSVPGHGTTVLVRLPLKLTLLDGR